MKFRYPCFFLVSSLFCCLPATAQGTWENEKEIYNDGTTTVTVSFSFSSNSCDPTGAKQNKYRFNVSGSLRSGTEAIEWKTEYKNCQNITVPIIAKIDIGYGAVLGYVESMDYRYPGSKVTNIPKATLSKATYVPPPPPPPPPTTTYGTHPGHGHVIYKSPEAVRKAKIKAWIQQNKMPGYEVGLGIGLDMSTQPMTTTHTVFDFAGPVVSAAHLDPYGMGLRADLTFHPLFMRNIQLGLHAGGALGSTPLTIGGANHTSDDETTTTTTYRRYTYTKFDFDIEFAGGGGGFKILIKYINSLQTHNYQVTKTYTNDYTGVAYTEDDVFVNGIRREMIDVGVRFSNHKKFRDNSKGKPRKFRQFDLDLLYHFGKDHPWSWSAPQWEVNNVNDWQMGIGLDIWVLSVLRLKADVSFLTLASGTDVRLSDRKQIYSQVSLIYNANWIRKY